MIELSKKKFCIGRFIMTDIYATWKSSVPDEQLPVQSGHNIVSCLKQLILLGDSPNEKQKYPVLSFLDLTGKGSVTTTIKYNSSSFYYSSSSVAFANNIYFLGGNSFVKCNPQSGFSLVSLEAPKTRQQKKAFLTRHSAIIHDGCLIVYGGLMFQEGDKVYKPSTTIYQFNLGLHNLFFYHYCLI